jgi:hypothetical protein
MKTYIVTFEDKTEMWLTAKSRAELLKTLRIFGIVNKVTKVTEVNQ